MYHDNAIHVALSSDKIYHDLAIHVREFDSLVERLIQFEIHCPQQQFRILIVSLSGLALEVREWFIFNGLGNSGYLFMIFIKIYL